MATGPQTAPGRAMSFVGGGWRSGAAGDITGAASTATVTGLAPTTAARNSVITLTVNGTGFTNTTIVYAGYNPLPTTYVSATQLQVVGWTVNKDDGTTGVVPISARKSGE